MAHRTHQKIAVKCTSWLWANHFGTPSYHTQLAKNSFATSDVDNWVPQTQLGIRWLSLPSLLQHTIRACLLLCQANQWQSPWSQCQNFQLGLVEVAASPADVGWFPWVISKPCSQRQNSWYQLTTSATIHEIAMQKLSNIHQNDNGMHCYAILARETVKGHLPLVWSTANGRVLVYDKPATNHAIHKNRT